MDTVTKEVLYLSTGNFPAERLIVFCAVTLQRDRLIEKVKDIRRIVDRRLGVWNRGEFDLLIQEALRCDKSLKNKNIKDMLLKFLQGLC